MKNVRNRNLLILKGNSKVDSVAKQFMQRERKYAEVLTRILDRNSKQKIPTEEALWMDILLFKDEERQWKELKQQLGIFIKY